MIVGIDEVGRGPWAGPLVVGAVALGCEIEGLTDSKKLTKKRREVLNGEIIEKAAAVGLGWVHADELDELGISRSLIEATKRALEQITVPYHEIIIDGTVNFLADTGKGPYVTTLKKADLLIPSVSAASIVAKVARDSFMTEQDTLHQGYGFSSHVGYGTAAHRRALEEFGITPLHRKSFAPIAALLGKQTEPKVIDDVKQTSKSIGDNGEDVAAMWLSAHGYDIVARNWKTKFCEIDIIAKKDRTVYFVEVKHRKTTQQGGGMAAITPRKLRQMRFAAELYRTRHTNDASEWRLAVVATNGDIPQFETFLVVE